MKRRFEPGRGAVVEHEDPPQVELAREQRRGGRLGVVGRVHAGVVADAGGVEVRQHVARLQSVAVGEADQRVRSRDQRQRSARGAIQDRDLDAGAVRVVGADDPDDGPVRSVGLRVGLAFPGVRLVGIGRRGVT